jgi:hypothetical protein
MIVDIEDMIDYRSIKNKITYIIPTSTAPVNNLLWSVFSLLLRTKPEDCVEHFCVSINGPDKRTGDPTLQDKKQAFLEELRRLKWYHTDNPQNGRDMPVTVLRTWSRIGHPQAIESVLPWVHTDSYAITHDDIILAKHDWTKELKEKFFDQPDVAIANVEPLLCAISETARLNNKNLLRFPHMLTTFLVCKKKLMARMQANWIGYHIEKEFTIDELTGNADEFIEYWKNFTNHNLPPMKGLTYNYISMEIGAWIFQKMREHNLRAVRLNPKTIAHFVAMSWDTTEAQKMKFEYYKPLVKELEEEIKQHPEYSKLYEKYKN